MKKLKYIKTFESFRLASKKITPINEGGGAGIEFTSTCGADYQYLLKSTGIELIKKEISELENFDAIGYQDGRRDNDSSLLKMEEGKGITAEMLYPIKISNIEYSAGEDNTLDVFPNWVSDTDTDMTVGEYLTKFPDEEVEVSLSVSVRYKDMHFGGWLRGTFSVGDTILTYDPSVEYRSDINGDYSHIYFGKAEYIADKGESRKESSRFEDLLSCITPNFVATEEFLDWYQDVFVDHVDDEDFEDEDLDESLNEAVDYKELIKDAMEKGESETNDMLTLFTFREGRLGIRKFFGKNRKSTLKTNINNASELSLDELEKEVKKEIKNLTSEYKTQNESVNEAVEKVKTPSAKIIKELEKDITYSWINTDMGSGWRFKLGDKYGILLDRKYLDQFDGEGDDDYKEWKEELLTSSYADFKQRAIKDHIGYYTESLNVSVNEKKHEFYTKTVIVDAENAKEFVKGLYELGFKWDQFGETERFDKVHFDFDKTSFKKIGDLVKKYSEEVFDIK